MLNGAEYHLTNGLFEVEHLTLGVGAFISKSFFNQYGGTVKAGTFGLDAETYRLFAGELIVRTNESLKGGAFIQSGGTHRVPSLSIFQSYNGGGAGFYSLEGGTLAVRDVSIGAFLTGSSFQQIGGSFEIAKTFTLSGSSRYHPPHQIPATYALIDGTMRAEHVELNSRWGLAQFLQNGGNVLIIGQLRLNVPESDTRSYFSIGGGVLHVASISSQGAGADIRQTGGEIRAPYGFAFGATFHRLSGQPVIVASHGTNSWRDARHDRSRDCRRIDHWQFSAVQSDHKPGSFSLAGTIRAGDCQEEDLGSLNLLTNSLIDLVPVKPNSHSPTAPANPGNPLPSSPSPIGRLAQRTR